MPLAPATYVSLSLAYLRSRWSLANIICSQATGHHCFVPFFSIVPFFSLWIVSSLAESVRKGNHYFANFHKKSKLLLRFRSFLIVPFLSNCPVPF